MTENSRIPEIRVRETMDWNAEARTILKAELARHGVTYKVLAIRLEAIGVKDSEAAIANRLSRGRFSFAFFLQCMRAIEVNTVTLWAKPAVRRSEE